MFAVVVQLNIGVAAKVVAQICGLEMGPIAVLDHSTSPQRQRFTNTVRAGGSTSSIVQNAAPSTPEAAMAGWNLDRGKTSCRSEPGVGADVPGWSLPQPHRRTDRYIAVDSTHGPEGRKTVNEQPAAAAPAAGRSPRVWISAAALLIAAARAAIDLWLLLR